jgi:gluconate 2-dehydrogenase gamma chain
MAGGTHVTNHDATRRDFLVRAAIGAGTAVSAALVPSGYAQSPEPSKGADPAAQEHSANVQQGAFFNYEDAATIAAFTERLMPGAPGKPGAGDAGVLNYIDLALAGAYADLQDFYRRGLAQLDAHCRKNYSESFVRLDSTRQDEVISLLEQGKANEFAWPTARAFFETLRTHTMEGMFADPVYGGNKDFAGWRLVSFPGVQAVFTPADLQSKDPFTRAPLIGLQTKAPMRMG